MDWIGQEDVSMVVSVLHWIEGVKPPFTAVVVPVIAAAVVVSWRASSGVMTMMTRVSFLNLKQVSSPSSPSSF